MFRGHAVDTKTIPCRRSLIAITTSVLLCAGAASAVEPPPRYPTRSDIPDWWQQTRALYCPLTNSGAGGSLGVLSGYVLGRSGRGFTRNHRFLAKSEEWMKKRGLITVFLFSLLPFLPFDIVGIIAGALRFPIWKFLLACFIGKSILYIILIQAFAWGWDALTRFID